MPTVNFGQDLLLPSFGYMEAQTACDALNRKNPNWNVQVAFNRGVSFSTDYPVEEYEFRRAAAAELRQYFGGFAANLNAVAYAQGADIHLMPGQEKHLAHEVWHVTQQ